MHLHQDLATRNRFAPARDAHVSTAGCHAFTRELCRVVWRVKFKPELPPRYDSIPDPWSSSSSTR